MLTALCGKESDVLEPRKDGKFTDHTAISMRNSTTHGNVSASLVYAPVAAGGTKVANDHTIAITGGTDVVPASTERLGQMQMKNDQLDRVTSATSLEDIVNAMKDYFPEAVTDPRVVAILHRIDPVKFSPVASVMVSSLIAEDITSTFILRLMDKFPEPKPAVQDGRLAALMAEVMALRRFKDIVTRDHINSAPVDTDAAAHFTVDMAVGVLRGN